MTTPRELAERLGIDEKRATIRDWLAESAPEDEASGSKLDETIAQLAVRFGDAAAAPYCERAEAMELEADPHRRKLLMDSLAIEMAKFVRDETARERLIEEADAVLAGLWSDGALFTDAIKVLETAIKTATGASLSQAIAAARSEQDRRISERGLAHRRKALLDALARLGYEVEEGMETAFAKDGRVVIERTDRPGYGVELSGLLVNDKLQVRAMRFADSEAKGSSDLEHETEWCSTFSDLRAVLGEASDEIVIEKALGVGERPLKVIERQVRRRAERRVQRTAD